MIVKRVNLCALDTGSLTLGYVGENDHTQIRINCASVFADYPAAVVSMTVKAPSGVVYPREVETDGQVVIWTITDSDTASAGNGQIQLTFTEDGTIVKTVIAVTTVRASLVGDNPPPDPITDWIDEAGEALAKLEGMTAGATQLPAGEDPTAEVEIVDGHYNIALGIPGGDAESIIDDTAGVGDTTKVWSANKSATDLSELKSEIDSKAPAIYQDASGDIVSITDGADGMPVKAMTVSVDPAQDLHGYDYPWPSGGGVNLLNADGYTLSLSSGTDTTNVIPYYANLTAGQTYTISCRQAANAGTVTRNIIGIRKTAQGSSVIAWESENTGTAHIHSLTFTPTDTDEYAIVYWAHTLQNAITVDHFQIEKGSSVSPYAPYSNVCPISGWTGAQISRTGKNLLNWEAQTVTYYGVTFTVNADGSITVNGTATGADASFYSSPTYPYDVFFKAGSYIMSGCPSGGSTTTYFLNETRQAGSDTGNGRAFTLAVDSLIRIRICVRNGVTVNNLVFKPMIRLASETDATYEPYIGTTYPITWQTAGTVYGANLTVHQDGTGKLVVDRIVATPTAISGIQADLGRGYLYSPDKVALAKDVNKKPICDMLKSELNVSNHVFSVGQYGGGASIYFISLDDTYDTLAKYNAWLAENNPTIVLWLDEPIAYNLNALEVIETLKGVNNILADAGAVALTYPADTKLYIETLTKPTEDDMTANTAITSGKFFMVGNRLFLSTAAIAVGATIIPGTNCTELSLADALNNINA